MNIEQTVIEKLRVLSPEKQQEVLDFIEFLEGKAKRQQLPTTSRWKDVSALEAAQSVMGIVGDGSPDLSTNPKYMDGFGE